MECQKEEELWNFLAQTYYIETYLRNTSPSCIPTHIYKNLLTVGVEIPLRGCTNVIDVIIFAQKFEEKQRELMLYFNKSEIEERQKKVLRTLNPATE